jgi:Zn-dependent M28 family amino/carboxypeptidase
VLLLFFTGEEAGLLGSDYYVTRPLWPLYQVRAVINLDAGAPPAPPVTWRLAGVDSSGLGATALAIAAARGWTATTSPPRPNSDYFPFIREGVPAVFIIPGAGPYEGLTADSSDALRRRWDRYHEPDDEWAEDFPFGGLRRYAEFALSLVRAIDSSGTDYRASLTGTRSDPGGSK